MRLVLVMEGSLARLFVLRVNKFFVLCIVNSFPLAILAIFIRGVLGFFFLLIRSGGG